MTEHAPRHDSKATHVVAHGLGASESARANNRSSVETAVMVADAHPVFRVGLGSLLRSAGLEVVGEARDADDAVQMAACQQPDVTLMDLDLNGAPSVEVVRRIVAAAPRARIVMLAITADDVRVFGALAAGACGCILKNAPIHEILAATRSAAQGESVVSPPIASRLIRRLPASLGDGDGTPALSKRELEVLELLARGWDNTRIAAALYVSRGTVKHHISSILAKLNVDNRIQAAVRAVRDGLVNR